MTEQKQIIKKQGKDFANLEKITQDTARIETELMLQELKTYCSALSKSFVSDLAEMCNAKKIALSDCKSLIKEDFLSILTFLVQNKVGQRKTNAKKPQNGISSSF